MRNNFGWIRCKNSETTGNIFTDHVFVRFSENPLTYSYRMFIAWKGRNILVSPVKTFAESIWIPVRTNISSEILLDFLQCNVEIVSTNHSNERYSFYSWYFRSNEVTLSTFVNKLSIATKPNDTDQNKMVAASSLRGDVFEYEMSILSTSDVQKRTRYPWDMRIRCASSTD